MVELVPSAVAVPETDTPPPASPTNGVKRRPSSVFESNTKRQRVPSVDGNNAHTDRRGSTTDNNAQTSRERGRARRLFGNVLGALAQSGPSAAEKKRAEIANRQRARREQGEQQSDEDPERNAQRHAQRRVEQHNFEKAAVSIS